MIAFCINELDIRGGTHKQLLKLLQSAAVRNIAFKIITKRVDLEKTYPGFAEYKDKIFVIGNAKSRNWLFKFLTIRKLIRDVEVVNIHDCGFEGIYEAFWGKKVVLQINDLPREFHEGVAQGVTGSLRDKWRAMKIRIRTYLFVDVITVNVGKNADRVRKHFGVDARVLYCGVEPIDVVHDNRLSFERFRNRQVRLLSSGVFFPYRNYESLVRAVAILRAQKIDATLRIFGTIRDAGYYEQICNLIHELNLGDYVKILGAIDECEYLQIHEDSDIFCFVNVEQSWGLAVFEAMSAGLPVVVSNSVGATEILHDGVDAYFVDPLDPDAIFHKIMLLVENNDVYASSQKEGLELTQRFSWERSYCNPMLEILLGGMPVLTVVSASYNVVSSIGLEVLRRNLLSVAALPFAHEHLIYDGASTDGTVDVLKSLATEIEGIKIVSEKDSGIYEALNKGLREARGRFFYVMGLDDQIIDPKQLAVCVKTAIRRQCDMFIAPIVLEKERNRRPSSRWECVNVARRFSYGHQGVFIRTELLQSDQKYCFDEKYRIAGDYKQLLSLHWADAKVGWSSKPYALFAHGGISTRQDVGPDECFVLQREVFGLSSEEDKRHRQTGRLPLRIALHFLRGGYFSKMMGLRVLLSYFWRKHKTETHSIYLLCGICVFRHLKKSMRSG